MSTKKHAWKFSINSYTATFDNDGVTTSQTVDYQGLLQEPTAPTKRRLYFQRLV
ncbi:InlB B-repeat-containing protein [Listeria monocytogenes]|uniref:InlB B-repeat-containing protein n=1 Tax=Listeria monocytogenes TaxID=1639 RepID=UPI0035CCDFC1